MALAMLVTPVNITSVKADQIYNIEKSSQSQITENKIEKLISSQKADIRTGSQLWNNKSGSNHIEKGYAGAPKHALCFCKVKEFCSRPNLLRYRR